VAHLVNEILVDFTAAAILDKFQNEAGAQAVDRVLKKLSSEKAAEIIAVSSPATFIEFLFESRK
jgi:mitochondrial import receptor subunit TOM70